MSWAFYTAGTPEFVREQVKKQTAAMIASPQSAEQDLTVRACIEAVEGACRAAEQTVPDARACIAVECSGHLAPSAQYGNVDLRIRINGVI